MMSKRMLAIFCATPKKEYETGQLSGGAFVGKTGKVKLIVEKGKNGYGDKNAVADYTLRWQSQKAARIYVAEA